MGWKKPPSPDGHQDGRTLAVDAITGGLIQKWNEEHPDKVVGWGELNVILFLFFCVVVLVAVAVAVAVVVVVVVVVVVLVLVLVLVLVVVVVKNRSLHRAGFAPVDVSVE